MSRNAFTSRRRLERFVGRRRTNSESNNQSEVYRTEHILALPPPIDRCASFDHHSETASTLEVPERDNEDDFDSAPELADMELIHRILKRTKQKDTPKRTASFTSYNINRQVRAWYKYFTS